MLLFGSILLYRIRCIRHNRLITLSMKNTIENNKHKWDKEYHWSNHGDEWNGQARYCRQPYEAWKRSLIELLIIPYVDELTTAMEIAPGHGRWSQVLAERVKKLILVDISTSCIEHCKKVLGDKPHVKYHVNDGKTLNAIPGNTVDFIWSFDSFVHIDKPTTASYFSGISRVLKTGGKAIIHHPGRSHTFLWLGFVRHLGEIGKQLYKMISMQRLHDHDGWRANISAKTIRNLARKNRLKVIDQIQYWDDRRQFGVPRFNDRITILEK
jgi:ubiquinone/menaquinone biosynthesis C-methylase UbiE